GRHHRLPRREISGPKARHRPLDQLRWLARRHRRRHQGAAAGGAIVSARDRRRITGAKPRRPQDTMTSHSLDKISRANLVLGAALTAASGLLWGAGGMLAA